MQVLLIKFCLLLRKGSTKVFTNVAASFVKASFVSSKEGFQQKFPQKMLQVLLKQVLFPVRVGLTIHKFVFYYILHLQLYFTISRILKRDIYNIMHGFAPFYYIMLLSPAMPDLHGRHGTPSRNIHPRWSTLIAPPCRTYATNIIISHFTCFFRSLSVIL